MRTPRLPVVDWIDAPADLNGLVRFTERRILVSARVPSHFKRSVPKYFIYAMKQNGVWIFKQVVYIVNITTSTFDGFRSYFQISAMYVTNFFLLFFLFWNVFLKRCGMNHCFTMLLIKWTLCFRVFITTKHPTQILLLKTFILLTLQTPKSHLPFAGIIRSSPCSPR